MMRISSVFICCIFSLVTVGFGDEKLNRNLPSRREDNVQWKQLFFEFIHQFRKYCSNEDTLGYLDELKNRTFQDLNNNEIPYFSPCNLSERDILNLYTILKFEDSDGNPQNPTIKACKELPNPYNNNPGIISGSKIAKCEMSIKNRCVMKFHENTMALPGTKLKFQCQTGPVKSITCDDGQWRSDHKQICEIPNPFRMVFEESKNSAGCGQRFEPSQKRLIKKGEYAILGDYPWHAAVFNEKGTLICGATIINNNTLLSAAHCFYLEEGNFIKKPSSDFTIMVGKVSSNMSNIDSNDTQKFNITKIITHSYRGFGLLRGQNDIALIKIDGVITFGEMVGPICILEKAHDRMMRDIKHVETAGWGATVNTSASPTLQKANFTFLSYEKCVDQIPEGSKKPPPLSKYLTTDKCGIEDPEKSVEQGDSGGGVVLRHDDRYYLVAIISLVPVDVQLDLKKNSAKLKLSYSTYVPWYRDWIEEYSLNE